MYEHFKYISDRISSERRKFESLVREACIIVVLLGAGGKEIVKRRNIAKRLRDNGIIALIPEDDFAPDVAPSLTEEFIFKHYLSDLYLTHLAKYGQINLN